MNKQELLSYIREEVADLERAIPEIIHVTNRRYLEVRRDTFLDIYNKLMPSAFIAEEDETFNK